jgi:alcohol dehydrogenase class IV
LAAFCKQEEQAMGCCHHYFAATEGGEDVFSVDVSSIAYGPGALREAGEQAKALGIARIALFTDKRLAALEHVAIVRKSLQDAGIDIAFFDEARVEPTDESFQVATRFAAEAKVDGFISVGGGSVIDTAKAASLYATYPADFLAYVNAPVGEGRPVPGKLKPHIACPTTSGTGSECTGIAVFDLLSMKAKTGIASRHLRPAHALESYTSMPFTRRTRSRTPAERPMSQGANPWSDLGCREALKLAGRYMVRAVTDAADHEAREGLMWASTLAGIAFGNSGVHVPHGMAYAVAGLVRDYRPEGYPDDEPIIPHGMSVIVNALSVLRNTDGGVPGPAPGRRRVPRRGRARRGRRGCRRGRRRTHRRTDETDRHSQRYRRGWLWRSRHRGADPGHPAAAAPLEERPDGGRRRTPAHHVRGGAELLVGARCREGAPRGYTVSRRRVN